MRLRATGIFVRVRLYNILRYVECMGLQKRRIYIFARGGTFYLSVSRREQKARFLWRGVSLGEEKACFIKWRGVSRREQEARLIEWSVVSFQRGDRVVREAWHSPPDLSPRNKRSKGKENVL